MHEYQNFPLPTIKFQNGQSKSRTSLNLNIQKPVTLKTFKKIGIIIHMQIKV